METNCFSVFVAKGAAPSIVLRTMTGATVQGMEFDGQQHVVPKSIGLSSIDPDALEVLHFYGLDEVRYVGIRSVAVGLVTGWPYLLLHLGRFRRRVAQSLFNRRPLATGERLDILRDVVDATTLGGADAVDAMDLMTRRYGYRWADHPAWKEHHRRLDMQLELLADSGELSKVNHRFRPTGLGLRTLDDRKHDDRKHGSNWWVQVSLVVIAVAALVFTAAQTGFVKLPTLLDLTESKRNREAKSQEPPGPATQRAIPSAVPAVPIPSSRATHDAPQSSATMASPVGSVVTEAGNSAGSVSSPAAAGGTAPGSFTRPPSVGASK